MVLLCVWWCWKCCWGKDCLLVFWCLWIVLSVGQCLVMFGCGGFCGLDGGWFEVGLVGWSGWVLVGGLFQLVDVDQFVFGGFVVGVDFL